LFSAYSVSMLGSAVAPVALAFGVLGAPGGSATALGLVLFARSAAQVLLLMFGGVLADRLPRNWLMIVSSVVAGGAQTGVAVLFLGSRAPVIPLMALAAVNGAAAALFLPAARGILPQVVERSDLQTANGLLRLARNGSTILGASLGGVLVVTAGAGWALAIDAASFFLAAGLLLRVRPGPRGDVRDAVGRAGLLTELREGWQEFRSRTWVWVPVAQFAVVNLCFAPSVNVLGPVVAEEHYSGAAGWSVILTVQAVGLVGGSLLAIRLRPRFPLRTGALATFGFLPPFVLLAVAAPLPLVAFSLFVNGVCVDVFEVMWDTTLQTHLPPGVISRVSSYDQLGSFVLGPLGLALVGPLAQAVGVRTTILGAGTLLLVATVLANLDPAVRRLPREPAPPRADPQPGRCQTRLYR
jgi:MFS family permease